MKKLISLLVLFALVGGEAFGASPVIYSGTRAKVLTSGGITLSNGTTLDNDGPTNAVKNAGAEDPTVPSGWAKYSDGAVDTPVDGTGGTASQITTIARDTTAGNLINGTGVWKLAKSAANAQGQGWAYSFTVPANWSGRNSLVSLSFNYFMSTASGDDIRVYVYDVTNSTLITPSFVTCGGGTAPKLTATTSVCQAKLAWVSSGATSYRLVFHVATTGTSAMNLFVDDISITDGRAQPGANVGEPVTYTPTIAGVGTATNVSFWYRRVGSAYQIWGSFTTGTVSATNFSFTLPNSHTIDSTKVTSDNTIFGTGVAGNGVAQGVFNDGVALVAFPDSGDYTKIYLTYKHSAATNLLVPIAANAFMGSSKQVTVGPLWVPVSELAGGTSFGENNVAYYCSTGNTWGTSNTSATTSSCPGGVLGGTTTPANPSFHYSFTPSSVIPVGSVAVLETSPDGTHWSAGTNPQTPATTETLRFDGTNYIGGSASVDSNGKIDVYFGKYAYGTSGAWTGTWYWRVKVVSPGVPVPFGLATSTTPGLVKTSAENDSAGDFGTSAAVNVTTTETAFRTTTITNAGTYLVIATSTVNNAQATASSDRGVGMTVYQNSTLRASANQQVLASSSTNYANISASCVITAAAGDTVTLKLAANANGVVQKFLADLVVVQLPKVN